MAESFNHFGQIAAALDQASQQIPRKTALDIQAGYAANAPRDTGFMANSAYVTTIDSSTYGNAGTPPKDAYLLPEEKPVDKYTAIVAVGANYAIYPELGTVHMAPRPAFYPAIDAARPGFEAATAAIKDAMERASS